MNRIFSSQPDAPVWSIAPPELLKRFGSSLQGLPEAEAAKRLLVFGPNAVGDHASRATGRMLLSQFSSPLVLILLVAAGVSATVGEWLDAAVVIAIASGSAILGFYHEYSAASAVARLRGHLTLSCNAIRNGVHRTLEVQKLVPGDIVHLSAGTMIPADGVVLSAKDFFVNQAVLTGETFPSEKTSGVSAADADPGSRTNFVLMGSSVRSGIATVLITYTGSRTLFGTIAHKLDQSVPQGDFERGLRQFGVMLTEVTLVLVLIAFAASVVGNKGATESLLFAIALAVGVAPELLPAIFTVTLSIGAQRMAARGVIVRRLSSIENLGSVDVLCTDKTGTLTEGSVRLEAARAFSNDASPDVLTLAALNALHQTGLENPLDAAICDAARNVDLSNFEKVDEIPYDFVRKRLSVVVRQTSGPQALIITKGALEQVLSCCSYFQRGALREELTDPDREDILKRFHSWSDEGYRVLGVATATLEANSTYSRDSETGLTFRGFLLFHDPPKPGIEGTLDGLRRLGVDLKIVTGDDEGVTRHLAATIGVQVRKVITGSELSRMDDEALWHAAEQTQVFARVDPNQKERIIRALQKTGHVVGYLGDGINDAPALKAADAGISVDSAVDVAKDAADFILLEHDLGVLAEGIVEGRRTFANTLKYIFTTTSANFGNMVSMTAASLVLPFLPLLAKQILLNNFLSDIPAMTLARDRVDDEWLSRPQRWDIAMIRQFMVVFGLVSAMFDFLTFGVLMKGMRADADLFRTAWFVESLLTELAVALVVRTRFPFYRQRPGQALLVSTILVAAVAIVLPYSPIASAFGFVPLSLNLLVLLGVITGAYVGATEMVKVRFFRRKSGAVGSS